MAAGLKIDGGGAGGRSRETGWLPVTVIIQTRDGGGLHGREVRRVVRSHGLLGAVSTVG